MTVANSTRKKHSKPYPKYPLSPHNNGHVNGGNKTAGDSFGATPNPKAIPPQTTNHTFTVLES